MNYTEKILLYIFFYVRPSEYIIFLLSILGRRGRYVSASEKRSRFSLLLKNIKKKNIIILFLYTVFFFLNYVISYIEKKVEGPSVAEPGGNLINGI